MVESGFLRVTTRNANGVCHNHSRGDGENSLRKSVSTAMPFTEGCGGKTANDNEHVEDKRLQTDWKMVRNNEVEMTSMGVK